MKVIFLDVDGVLNNQNTPIRWEDKTLLMNDPTCVFFLNRLVDRTGAELVLSSSWRHDPNWRQNLKDNGVIKDFLDRTPTKNVGNETQRGLQINAWLSEHPEVKKFAIIDDNNWMLPDQLASFFKTSWLHGLTEEIADNIERHLAD